MQRPTSILAFERLYLASFALWVVSTAVFWNVTMGAINAAPGMAENPMASMMPTFLIGSVVVTALVALVLWYGVARKASVVAKWFVVVTEGLGALTALFTLLKLLRGATLNPVMAVLSLVVTGLAVAAATMLFKPDAKAWFGEDAVDAADMERPLP